MKIYLIGHKGSKKILKASSYLAKKYLPSDFEINYVNFGYFDESKLNENEDFKILNLRYELNLIILILSILSFKKKTISQKYIETYIKHVNPKILITFIDNNIFFYDLKLKSKDFKKKWVAILVKDNPGFFINQSLVRIPETRPSTPTPDNKNNNINLNIEILKKLNI